MAVMNGTAVLVTVGGVDINLLTECSISLNREVMDTTNKESGGFKSGLPGLMSGSINFSSLHDESATYNLQELFAAWSLATPTASIKFTTEATGDFEFSASGIITSLEQNAGTEDNVTISGTMELTGAITYTVIS